MFARFFVPDTFDYLIAGYVVLTLVLSIYIGSIAVRWKKAATQYRAYQDSE